MNNITRKFFGSVLIFLITPLLISAEKGGGRKIVVFSDALNEQAKDELVSKHGGVKFKDLSLINGSAVWLPDTASEEALEQHAGILRIDDDIEVFALDRNNKANKAPAPSPSQTLPWGIDRIDAELVWPTGNTANPIKVGIIDTGISKDHPDLAVNIKGGVNTINPTKSWNDDNGHGSHVAGIAAALNNSLGVVGAGPNIDLYAIKVLNRNGSGFLSDVIEGIQWATANGIKVANMSLGSTSNVQSFHDAVIAAYNAGVTIVAAAGNSGGAVSFPAAYPEVIAVSATDIN
ncbi:MAG: S8 family serine peptidase, partial [Patescibacteria group bacterium]